MMQVFDLNDPYKGFIQSMGNHSLFHFTTRMIKFICFVESPLMEAKFVSYTHDFQAEFVVG